MIRKYFLTILVGCFVCGLSHNLLAACNTNINTTKPNSIYIDHLDGTVTDSETSLMWQKCSLGQTWNAGAGANDGTDDSCDGSATSGTWHEALTQANADSRFNYSDWRLPNKNELRTLVEMACYNPPINEAIFPDTQSRKYYWSSTPSVSNNRARVVHFGSGSDTEANKSSIYYIRFVRDSQ